MKIIKVSSILSKIKENPKKEIRIKDPFKETFFIKLKNLTFFNIND